MFRAPILVRGIEPFVSTWKKPITIARHAYGDVYKASETAVPQGARAEIVVTDSNGAETRTLIHDFASGAGVVQGMHNIDGSIASFARSCFNYALATAQDLWFATKDTISKKYDHRFKDIFAEIYEAEYKEKFAQKGIEYFYTLIDDAVARVIRSEGGFIWACKNYDGDVMSDMVATAFNSMATLFAWTGALRKRGELDGSAALAAFADKLEAAAIRTIEDGVMTKDLFLLSKAENKRAVDTEAFILAVRDNLEKSL